MMDFRKSVTIVMFMALCLGVVLYSAGREWGDSELEKAQKEKKESAEDISYFKNVNYYVMRGEEKALHLNSSDLSINNTQSEISFINPQGTAFPKNGEAFLYQAEKGFYHTEDELLFLETNVHLKTENSDFASDKAKYELGKEHFFAVGNVKSLTLSKESGDKIFVDSDEAQAWPKDERGHYEGNVKGRIKRKKVYEENVDFKANDLYLEMKQQKISLSGDVFIKRAALRATARGGEILLENYNKNLKYFTLFDDVRVVEKVSPIAMASFERKAFSEKLEGIMPENKIILTGYPKVFQQNDVLRGNRITLRENTEVVEVDDASTNFIIKKKGQ